jgi:methionyl-tRNA formyltransferase
MKIILITQSVNAVLHALTNSNFELIGLAENAPRVARKKPKAGTVSWIKSKLKSALGKVPVDLKGYCSKKQIPYLYFGAKDHEIIKAWVTEKNPDLIVVFGMSMLLKKEVFNIPKYGAINLHPAYLPDFRGPNAFFWHYYAFEINPGVTVHYIDEGEDTGDIILQERITISLGIKRNELYAKLNDELGVRLLIEAINMIENNSVVRIPQPKDSPTPRARNFDSKEYASLIDWKNWSTVQIWHLLRSTNNVKPFFPENTFFIDKKIKVCGEIIDKRINMAPGTIFSEHGRDYVVTSDKIIELV